MLLRFGMLVDMKEKNFLAVNDDLRAEEKAKQAVRKEKEFVKLIISAYKAEPVDSFVNMVGKKKRSLGGCGTYQCTSLI